MTGTCIHWPSESRTLSPYIRSGMPPIEYAAHNIVVRPVLLRTLLATFSSGVRVQAHAAICRTRYACRTFRYASITHKLSQRVVEEIIAHAMGHQQLAAHYRLPPELATFGVGYESAPPKHDSVNCARRRLKRALRTVAADQRMQLPRHRTRVTRRYVRQFHSMCLVYARSPPVFEVDLPHCDQASPRTRSLHHG